MENRQFRPFGVRIPHIRPADVIYEPCTEEEVNDLSAYAWFDTSADALAWAADAVTRSYGRGGGEIPSVKVRNELRAQGIGSRSFHAVVEWDEVTHCRAEIELPEFTFAQFKRRAINAVHEGGVLNTTFSNVTRRYSGIPGDSVRVFEVDKKGDENV